MKIRTRMIKQSPLYLPVFLLIFVSCSNSNKQQSTNIPLVKEGRNWAEYALNPSYTPAPTLQEFQPINSQYTVLDEQVNDSPNNTDVSLDILLSQKMTK